MQVTDVLCYGRGLISHPYDKELDFQHLVSCILVTTNTLHQQLPTLTAYASRHGGGDVKLFRRGVMLGAHIRKKLHRFYQYVINQTYLAYTGQ